MNQNPCISKNYWDKWIISLLTCNFTSKYSRDVKSLREILYLRRPMYYSLCIQYSLHYCTISKCIAGHFHFISEQGTIEQALFHRTIKLFLKSKYYYSKNYFLWSNYWGGNCLPHFLCTETYFAAHHIRKAYH